MSLKTAFERLKDLLSESHLEYQFNPGVSAEEISSVEAKMGWTFTDELREWFSLCNGQPVSSEGALCGFHFMSLERAMKAHSHLERHAWMFHHDNKNPHLKPGRTWWESWIPIGSEYSHTVFFYDVDPPASGSVGQIFSRSNNQSVSSIIVVGIEQLLVNISTPGLKNGYVYDDPWHWPI